MSHAILRRNSSKQGLQNLLRVTAQRSVEDAEEIERERRCRARTKLCGETPNSSGIHLDDGLSENDCQPIHHTALEEDEGFSDWTQRLERQRQRGLGGSNLSSEEQSGMANIGFPKSSYSPLSNGEVARQADEDEWTQKKARNHTQRDRGTERERRLRRDEEGWRRDREGMGKVQKTQLKISYTSKVFLPQEVRHVNGNESTAGQETMSYTSRESSTSRNENIDLEDDEVRTALEKEARLESFQRSCHQAEQQGMEELRQKKADSEEDLEELSRRIEGRLKVREEVEQRNQVEEQLQRVREKEEGEKMKETIRLDAMEAMEKMKRINISNTEAEEPFSPISPKNSAFKNENEERVTAESTCSITERTESLNRSLKTSNSFKKIQAPVVISRIDNRLEQYSQAIEISSKEAIAVKQMLMDIPSPSEPISCKKNLFEAGEAWNQNDTKNTPSKDTEGLKVGVADLINQWVRGASDDTAKNSSSRPAEVNAGDVLHKKNLWETLGDSGRPEPTAKGNSSGKRYKFVVTGHGKYEKVFVDDDCSEYAI
ncbi:non-muscle caldesmon-like isoform X2 [Denticeps clupeoides]|uniref:non-muscle caldesmon-like isoform X2 n=1 Tax=Denticeps clupeoides TaxID=299321 RepID=UPI0010A34866|nr:non-muscle caldesmon-like isoform X2 [Denticeps clupeoides]